MQIKAVDATVPQMAKAIKKEIKHDPFLTLRIYAESPDIFKKNGDVSKKAIEEAIIDRFEISKKDAESAKVITEDSLDELNLPSDATLDAYALVALSTVQNTIPNTGDSEKDLAVDLTQIYTGNGSLEDLRNYAKAVKKKSGGDLKEACKSILKNI